jgi:hypothetical protein
MLQFQLKDQAELERARNKSRSEIFKQLLLLPITGGLSFLKYLRSRLKG